MDKIERCAAILECDTISAETSNVQETACKFYSNTGWTRCENDFWKWLDFFQIVTFKKKVSKGGNNEEKKQISDDFKRTLNTVHE